MEALVNLERIRCVEMDSRLVFNSMLISSQFFIRLISQQQTLSPPHHRGVYLNQQFVVDVTVVLTPSPSTNGHPLHRVSAALSDSNRHPDQLALIYLTTSIHTQSELTS